MKEKIISNNIGYYSGSSLLSAGFLKIASLDSRNSSPVKQFSKGVLIGTEMMAFIDACDDVIDDPENDSEKRLSIFKIGTEHTLEGVCTCSICSKPFQWGLSIHEKYIKRSQPLKEGFGELFEGGLDQLSTNDANCHRTALELIGRGSMQVMLHGANIATKLDISQKIIESANNFGVYAYMLDSAYEIEQDIKDNAMTYSTVAIAKGLGDASSIKKELIDTAHVHYEQGIRTLNMKQRIMYGSLAKLVKIRYQMKGKV